jgi:hypothetical protein
MRTLFIIVLIAFGVYACQQHHHPVPPAPVTPDVSPQDLAPLLVPLKPQPEAPESPTVHNPGLTHLDSAWQQGPCGHWVSPGERPFVGPCILV